MRLSRTLLGIVAVSLVLRVWLAFLGGQDFWPDESRYQRAQYVVYHAARGEWSQAATWLFSHADHLLFHWWGLPPALWEHFFGRNLSLAAAYYGLFSTACIYLVWWVARRAGAGDREALIAAFLAACANSLFYYSRHLLPYDVGLALLLLALGHGLGEDSWRRSFRTGVIAGLGFLTYNGYWLLGGCVLVLHVLARAASWRRALIRAAWAGAGLILPIVIIVLSAKSLGFDLIKGYRESAGTITQGDFHLGYRVIGEFLWQAERGLLMVWLLGLLAGLWFGFRERGGRGIWWLGAVLFLAGGLVLFSDILPKFVVYGRIARTFVPFLCLLTAWSAGQLAAVVAIPRRAWAGAATVIAAMAAWNFSTPLRQVFPADFMRVAHELAFARQKVEGWGAYKLLFADSLWGRDLRVDLPAHDVLLRRSHPLQYRPYQYEGYSRRQRKEINTHDVSMRLVRLREEGAPLAARTGNQKWRGFPGPVKLTLKLSGDEPGRPQPLVTAGVVQNGDFLFYIPDAEGRVRFGYDSWGGGSFVMSEPVPVDFSAEHELLLSMGALYPPAIKADAAYQGVCGHLVIVLDGRPVVTRQVYSHDVAPETITFGVNLIGGSTAGQLFRGDIKRIVLEDVTSVGHQFRLLLPDFVSSLRPAEWKGRPGPLRLRLALPANVPAGRAQPLLSFGEIGNGDALFWMKEDDGRIRLGIDRSGDGAVYSEPISVDFGAMHDVVVSLGSMMPAAGSSVFAASPAGRRLRELAFVAMDGHTVLMLRQTFRERPNRTVFVANTVGSATAGELFTGELVDVTAVDCSEVLSTSTQLAKTVGGRSKAWDGYSGPVKIRLQFARAQGRTSEPLLAAGVSGRGDLLFLQHEADGRIRFGLDHWGGRLFLSEPVVVDESVEHELIVSLGNLMPPAGSALYQSDPAAMGLRDVLIVALDGRKILARTADFHESRPEQIMLGVNSIDASTASGRLESYVLSVRGISVDEAREVSQLPFLQGPSKREAMWRGYPGPLKLNVTLPAMAPGTSLPLICAGVTGAGDLLFVEKLADGRVRFGFDHWGVGATPHSEPFAWPAGEERTLVIAVPFLMPPTNTDFYAGHPELKPLRNTVWLSFDGRVVWQHELTAFDSAPETITYGANFIGCSTAERQFGGELKDFMLEKPEDVLRQTTGRTTP
jgi:hypothetical protein